MRARTTCDTSLPPESPSIIWLHFRYRLRLRNIMCDASLLVCFGVAKWPDYQDQDFKASVNNICNSIAKFV